MSKLFEQVVALYIASNRRESARELASFRDEVDLPSAVKRAALAEDRAGKRLRHQWRLKRQVLVESASRLRRRAEALRTAGSFEQLHSEVERCIGVIAGIGPLTVYDTALRIGAFLHHEPELVYLHAGTREGARHVTTKWREKTVAKSDLPAAFQCLKAREIEDCFCIYEEALRTGRLNMPASCAPKAGTRRCAQ